MRRAHCLTLGLATVALASGFADASIAQSAPTAAPPRYLNWAGRSEAPPAPVAVAVAARPSPDQRRPNRVIPHGGAAPTPAPAPAAPRRTLTPANAWLRPAPVPAPVAAPAAAPAAPPAAPPAPRPVTSARTVPDFLPEQGGRGQPVPADVALAAPQPAASVAEADPMAPRRDAAIFRMQQPTAPGAQPVSQGADQGVRRYSVHRLNGQEPDALTMPAPSTVDVVTVNLDHTIASQDLAQPAEGPTLIRDAQGRVRAQPAAPEGDYQ